MSDLSLREQYINILCGAYFSFPGQSHHTCRVLSHSQTVHDTSIIRAQVCIMHLVHYYISNCSSAVGLFIFLFSSQNCYHSGKKLLIDNKAFKIKYIFQFFILHCYKVKLIFKIFYLFTYYVLLMSFNNSVKGLCSSVKRSLGNKSTKMSILRYTQK